MRPPKRLLPRPLPMLAALAVAALATAVPAIARDAADTRLPDAVRRIERETNGQVLKAEQMRSGSQRVPRVKVLTPDGRVRVMRADSAAAVAPLRPVARTGERALPQRAAVRQDEPSPLRDDGDRRQD